MSNSGAQIKKLRKYFDYTQSEFAEIAKTKRNSISMIESERNKPTFELIEELCNAFNLSADYFLSNDEPVIFDEIMKLAAHYRDTKNVTKNDNINVHLKSNQAVHLKSKKTSESVKNNLGFTSEEELNKVIRNNIKMLGFLWQRLVDIRVLLKEKLGEDKPSKTSYLTKEETELYHKYASIDMRELNGEEFIGYGYEVLKIEDKAHYNTELEKVIELFTNTFFKEFKKFYIAVRPLPWLEDEDE